MHEKDRLPSIPAERYLPASFFYLNKGFMWGEKRFITLNFVFLNKKGSMFFHVHIYTATHI
jgi:hypothetical protein